MNETSSTYIDRVSRALRRSASDAVANAAREYAAHLASQDLPILFDESHLAYVFEVPADRFPGWADSIHVQYRSFLIPKRAGGMREIRSPVPELRDRQRWILDSMLPALRIHDAAHGFVAGRSTMTNASCHLGATEVLRVDIEDFFPSVPFRRVASLYKRLGYTRGVAYRLAQISCLHGGLPQGAPSSPALANAALYGLDIRLTRFAERHRFVYTRYADDLVFSGACIGQPHASEVRDLVKQSGFEVNGSKTRIMRVGDRRLVTGLVVSDPSRARVPRRDRRWLRAQLHNLRMRGPDGVLVEDRERIPGFGRPRSNPRGYLEGKAAAMIPAEGEFARSALKELRAAAWMEPGADAFVRAIDKRGE